MATAQQPSPGGEVPRYRMTLSEYIKLEKAFSNARVDKTTTDLEAGFKLGVQEVLRYFRDNFVVLT